MTYYFMYDSSGDYPFIGGWSEVDAPSYALACLLHNTIHPRRDGKLDCSSVVSQAGFVRNKYEEDGYCGGKCREHIFLGQVTTDYQNIPEESKAVTIKELTDETHMQFRSIGVLQRAGFTRLYDILAIPTYQDLLFMDHCGERTAAEIIRCVHDFGYKMRWEQ